MSEAPEADETGDDDLTRLIRKGLDIVRYAPVGILLDGPALLPELAEKGKVHIKNARMLGDMALRQGREALLQRAGDAGTQAVDLLRLFGVVPEPAPDASETSTRAEADTAPAGALDVDRSPAARSAPTAEDLAIPGYDSLSASQVVSRLPSLSAEQLRAVRVYETAHRGRKTILNKIAQLQA
jgi:hypothetical protein